MIAKIETSNNKISHIGYYLAQINDYSEPFVAILVNEDFNDIYQYVMQISSGQNLSINFAIKDDFIEIMP